MKHLFCGGLLTLAMTLTHGAYAQYYEENATTQSLVATLPMGLSLKMTSQTMQNGVLSPAIPIGTLTSDDQGKEGDARLAMMGTMGVGAELDFNHWSIKNGPKGQTYWAIPNFVWNFGKDTELTLCVPMSTTDLRNVAGDINTIGTDLRLKQHIGDNFYVGGHINAGYANTRSYDDYNGGRNHDDFWTFGAGPFAGVDINLGERMTLTLGGLVDYGYSQNHINTMVGGLGASLGIQVASGLAVSPFITYYNYLQRDAEMMYTEDRDFFDVGINLLGAIKENWTFSVGVKETLGYENLNSWDFYIGTVFRF